MWVGLTGGMGCGKSTVAHLIRKKGYLVIDADAISKQLTEKDQLGYKAIVQEFGPGLLNLDGSLDRNKLSEIVFSNQSDLKRLENILHPLIQIEVNRQKMSSNQKIIFYDVPLLFEKKMESQFDKIVSVVCNEENQIERLKLRTHLRAVEIQKRIHVQIPNDYKIKHSDYIIQNDKSIDELICSVNDLINYLLIDLSEHKINS